MPKLNEVIWRQSYGKALLRIGSAVFLSPFLFYFIVILETKSFFAAATLFILTGFPVVLILVFGGISYRQASKELKASFATNQKANSTLSESEEEIWNKLEEDFNA